jgi:hypothetical protein
MVKTLKVGPLELIFLVETQELPVAIRASKEVLLVEDPVVETANPLLCLWEILVLTPNSTA